MKKRSKKGISIIRFLIDYYEIENPKLLKQIPYITHKELKEIAPKYGIKLKRAMSQQVTKEEELTGKYIFVSDITNNVIPYQNPYRKEYSEKTKTLRKEK